MRFVGCHEICCWVGWAGWLGWIGAGDLGWRMVYGRLLSLLAISLDASYFTLRFALSLSL